MTDSLWYADVPRNFRLEEFVSRHIFETYGPVAVQFIDPRIFITMDFIRNDRFKRPVTINNWRWGGLWHYRCYREPECEQGADNSQHRHGRGVDFDVAGIPAEEIRKDILDNPDLYPHITRIEADVSWVHGDCANWDREKYGIKVIRP